MDVLGLFEALHASGLTFVVVTHDERIAATADRVIMMRDGAFVDETRLTGGVIATETRLGQPKDHLNRALGQVPLARMGTADEVAAAVLWLLSDEASYVTGATLDVAGGL